MSVIAQVVLSYYINFQSFIQFEINITIFKHELYFELYFDVSITCNY